MTNGSYYGYLDYIDDPNNKQPHWQVTGSQAAMMAMRIVPGSWSSKTGTVDIPDNMSNVEHIEWLMMRYPLEVRSAERWNMRIQELSKIKKKREEIRSLIKYEKISPLFRGELRDFQKIGLDFLLKCSGCALLADEMGTGKTVHSLAYIVTEKDALPALIVAPLVTLENWRREIIKFVQKADGKPLKVEMIRSGKKHALDDRQLSIYPTDPTDIYLINYELLSKRKDDIERLPIRTIIADEVQNLRNPQSQKSQAIKEIANNPEIQHRLGLSGTPCYNHGTEIWSIIDFIYPGLLGTYNEFSREFVSEWDKSILPHKREAFYQILTENIMLRRRKEDVLKELPEKTRYKQPIEIDDDYYAKEMSKHLANLKATLASTNPNTDFRVQSEAYRDFANNERIVAGISKVPFVVEFVKEMMENEESVVVFCHHRAVHTLLHEKLMEYNPVAIIGGQTDQQRQNAIDNFQNGITKLMIAGMRAGNLGINLTTASYVIFAELDWSPAIHRQAEDRLHRMGQAKSVFAYYLEGKGTYDEHVSEVLVNKKVEIDEILGDKTKSEDYKEEDKLTDKAKELLSMLEQRFAKIGDIS